LIKTEVGSRSLPAVSLAGSGFKTNADNIRHFSYRPKSSSHFFKKEKSHAKAQRRKVFPAISRLNQFNYWRNFSISSGIHSWIPAFAGMTISPNRPSFPRRRESRQFALPIGIVRPKITKAFLYFLSWRLCAFA
jgi:hypothetical protein